MFGWLSRRDRSPGRLALRRFIMSGRSTSATKMQLDVTCVVLRNRHLKGVSSADSVNEAVAVALALKLGNCSAILGNVVVGGPYVVELFVDLSLTCANAVDFLVSSRSLVFSWWLLGLPVQYLFFFARSPC